MLFNCNRSKHKTTYIRTEKMNTQNQVESNNVIKQLLELKDVIAMTGLSSTTIYKHIKNGVFPQPKRCGSRAVRWRLSDIEQYINS